MFGLVVWLFVSLVDFLTLLTLLTSLTLLTFLTFLTVLTLLTLLTSLTLLTHRTFFAVWGRCRYNCVYLPSGVEWSHFEPYGF